MRWPSEVLVPASFILSTDDTNFKAKDLESFVPYLKVLIPSDVFCSMINGESLIVYEVILEVCEIQILNGVFIFADDKGKVVAHGTILDPALLELAKVQIAKLAKPYREKQETIPEDAPLERDDPSDPLLPALKKGRMN